MPLPLDTILHGDALAMLRTLPDASVDAIVTDPPAGILFMNRSWDSDKGGRDAWIAWLAEIMCEAKRVLKPGGHALVWALPRTSHWTAMALEDAGFEVRDRISHIFGSGFPKSLDVGKAIDKAAGAEREVVGSAKYRDIRNSHGRGYGDGINASAREKPEYIEHMFTAPATEAARQWDGWGTALKPAVEDWWLVRKPLAESTVAANVLRWDTGAIHVDACRVACDDKTPFPKAGYGRHATDASYQFAGDPKFKTIGEDKHKDGRWPPHLLLTHSLWCSDAACHESCPVRVLGEQSGEQSGERRNGGQNYLGPTGASVFGNTQITNPTRYAGDTGTAARYFPQFRYCAKASRAERNRGCEGLQAGSVHRYGAGIGEGKHPEAPVIEHNSHPTVKPLALMRWLIRLITPPGGIVLDCFAGSGSTLVAAQEEGMHYIGIEREAEYVAIAQARTTVREMPPKPKPKRKRVKPSAPRLIEVGA